MLSVFVKNSSNDLVNLTGERRSFQLKQRSKLCDGQKVQTLRFVSYKEAIKMTKNKNIYGPYTLYTVSKL
jgi:hypothetical protein